jgi:hypothetical protein
MCVQGYEVPRVSPCKQEEVHRGPKSVMYVVCMWGYVGICGDSDVRYVMWEVYESKIKNQNKRKEIRREEVSVHRERAFGVLWIRVVRKSGKLNQA